MTTTTVLLFLSISFTQYESYEPIIVLKREERY